MECFLCLGSKVVVVPFRDETDLAPCPNCYPKSVRTKRKITMQHPSVKLWSIEKREK